MVKKKSKKSHSKIKVVLTKISTGKAQEKHSFVLHDGRKLKSVYELIDELETMNDETFGEYVTDFKNDFSNWIRDVFENKPLSEELHRIKNRIDTQRAIMKHLVRDFKKLVKN